MSVLERRSQFLGHDRGPCRHFTGPRSVRTKFIATEHSKRVSEARPEMSGRVPEFMQDGKPAPCST